MKQSSKASFIAGMMICACVIGMTACQPVNTRNDPTFVTAADQFVNQSVGPEYEAILDGTIDPSQFTPEEIEDRKQNIRTFRSAVASAQAEIDQTSTPID